MRDVAIIGAGELGGALAHLLARRDTASSIVLIDDNGSLAAGKALDIAQAAPIERFSTRVSGARDLHAAAGADILVVADRGGATEWQGADGMGLVRRLAVLSPASVILCAGAMQQELVESGVRDGAVARQRLLGSAPEALVGAMKALIALEVNGSPSDVAVTILGVPPAHVVLPWDDATIGGLALWRTLDAPARRRLGALIPRLWPPGPYALAAAALSALEVMLGRSTRLMSVFVGPDDSSGRRTRAAALPARLGIDGLMSVELPPLGVHDQVALDTAMLL
jgi:malate dehydrogenase